MTSRSGGVWLVLHYILAEVGSGARRPDDLASLPVGLWQYYAQFWRSWQQDHADAWGEVDLPFLVALTATQEQVSVEFLCALAGITSPAGIDRAFDLVGDPWRPFLEIEEGADEERYRPFHNSLREFVAGDVDLDTLGSAERSFVRRLAQAHMQMHRSIADRYLLAWGGLDVGLPELRDGDGASLDGGYGLRQLVSHLIGAGAGEVLTRLLTLEWQRSAPITSTMNTWYEVHRRLRAFGAYARDIDRAWRHIQATPTGESIGLEILFALLTVSANSLAGNVPADLLVLLLESNQMPDRELLELAREIPDPTARAEALTTLVPHLHEELRSEALRDALASAVTTKVCAPEHMFASPRNPIRTRGELSGVSVMVKRHHVGDRRLTGRPEAGFGSRSPLFWWVVPGRLRRPGEPAVPSGVASRPASSPDACALPQGPWDRGHWRCASEGRRAALWSARRGWDGRSC